MLGVRYRVVSVPPCVVDPGALADVDVVFNLVESPPGRPGTQVEAAAAFEGLGLGLTGSSSGIIAATTDKEGTRRTLVRSGIGVAPGGLMELSDPSILEIVPPPWILKPALEDASLGLDDGAVTSDRSAAIGFARRLEQRFPGQPILVEHLLPGREFNISLLADGSGVEVLPPAEMAFVDFPADEPRIVGWKAKWDETSFAYRHTVRRFPSRDGDGLVHAVEDVARLAWTACGLAGYARVDLRLDEQDVPCVLEVNANPCLSPDAGFAAAAATAGLDPPDVVGRILTAAGWTP